MSIFIRSILTKGVIFILSVVMLAQAFDSPVLVNSKSVSFDFFNSVEKYIFDIINLDIEPNYFCDFENESSDKKDNDSEDEIEKDYFNVIQSLKKEQNIFQVTLMKSNIYTMTIAINCFGKVTTPPPEEKT